MKYIRFYSKSIGLLLCWFAVMPMGAVVQDPTPVEMPLAHHIGLAPKLGYSVFFNQMPQSRLVGGYTVGLDLQYLLQKNHFLFQTGLNFEVLNSASHLGLERIDRTMAQPYSTMCYHYDFLRFTEQNTLFEGTLPVLFGGEWNRFFFLAGASVSFPFAGGWKSEANVSVSATDEQFVEDLTNMPNHFLEESVWSGRGKTAFPVTLFCNAEIGLNLDHWLQKQPPKYRRYSRNRRKTFAECLHYRCSLFAQYGVLNSLPTAQGTHLVDFASADPMGTIAGTALAMEGKSVHPFSVGLKFAVQYQFQPPVKKRKPVAKAPVKKTPKTPKPKVPKPKVVPMSVGIVCDAQTGESLCAQIELYTPQGSTLYGQSCDVDSTAVPAFVVPLSSTEYGTYITKQGYLPYTQSVVCNQDTVRIALQPIQKGVKVILEDVFFATNKTNILPQSQPALEDLTHFLQENGTIHIRIVGHTDNVGSAVFNKKLSVGRAASVRDELIRRGIEPQRLEYEGKGMEEPIASNDTEEGRATNRRVEFVILQE